MAATPDSPFKLPWVYHTPNILATSLHTKIKNTLCTMNSHFAHSFKNYFSIIKTNNYWMFLKWGFSLLYKLLGNFSSHFYGLLILQVYYPVFPLKALMSITFLSPRAQPEVVYFLYQMKAHIFLIANPKFQLQILWSFADITKSVKLNGE